MVNITLKSVQGLIIALQMFILISIFYKVGYWNAKKEMSLR